MGGVTVLILEDAGFHLVKTTTRIVVLVLRTLHSSVVLEFKRS